jgi:hypothetical protein
MEREVEDARCSPSSGLSRKSLEKRIGSRVGQRVVEKRLFSREFQLRALNRLPQDLPLNRWPWP